MRLLYAEQVVVHPNKINDYLLSLTHPEGRTKARFFLSHGFAVEDPAKLIAALRQHVLANDASLSKESRFGRIYVVEGPLGTPDGRNPSLRSVWIIEPESSEPRLITAYPSP